MGRKKIDRKDKKCFLNFVWLAPSEYAHLCDLMGKEKTDCWIEELNLALGSKGDPYESHYWTIMNWERREKKKAGSRSQGPGTVNTIDAAKLADRVIQAIKDPGNKIMPAFDKPTFTALYAVLRKRMMRWPEVWQRRHDQEFLEGLRKELIKEFSLC